MHVKVNLELALRLLRHREKEVVLWIDALVSQSRASRDGVMVLTNMDSLLVHQSARHGRTQSASQTHEVDI